MGLHKTEKILHNKRNGLYTEETTYRVGENICQFYIKGLITRIYRELRKLNSPQINEPVKKQATELNRTFSKEEIQMCKNHMKKMFTISIHKGNANQNHVKIPPHTC
jgi:hypothetical protein